MQKNIGDIATVISGHNFRGAINFDTNGNFFALQAKDLVAGVPIADKSILTPVSLDGSGASKILKDGDVLLVSRGMKSGAFRSTVFRSKAENVVASSSVLVVRVNSDEVVPEYVSLYFNSQEGQFRLVELVSGSYIGALPRKSIERMKFPVPSLQKQKGIIDLHNNIAKQAKISDQKKKLKQEIINATFTNITKQHD